MEGQNAILAWINLNLLSLFEFHACGNRFSISQHFHFDHVADFATAQGIREIKQILDRHVAELNEDIVGLEPSLGRRRSRPHVGELHAVDLLSEIRYRTEVRPVTPAAPAARVLGGLIFHNGYERGPLRRGIDLQRNVIDEIKKLRDQLFKEKKTLWKHEALVDKPVSGTGLRDAVSLLLFGHPHGPNTGRSSKTPA